jgi:benzylsuccinate CoA-transferase BbsF subunit
MRKTGMALLTGFNVLQIGRGAAAAVCGRLLADVGAQVTCIDPGAGTMLLDYLNHGKAVAMDATERRKGLAAAHLIVREDWAAGRGDLAELRRVNPSATVVTISPYGETGPQADDPATDLTLFFASGISRLLTGQVDDLAEAPIRPVGEQSAFIGGLAAACAGMHAALGNQPGASIDVSSDGYAAISPREDKQWTSWLEAMGSPAWGADPRFAAKADRVNNWDALHALMSQWSRQHGKQRIADTAQDAHVPSFPLREVSEHLDTPQMRHRRYYQPHDLAGKTIQRPGTPFGLSVVASGRKPRTPAGPMPLSGIRVLDFSWVIAGPTTTRYLAAMGAEVIKVEAPGRGDPGRASELHTVLGQAKKSIALDLKKPQAAEIVRALAATSDILVENFATGVMDRLGLGAEALRAVNPDLIYISASGMGRTGPDSQAVAYGTLLQCYAGFAGLNRHPEVAPRIGMAWLDPMCGLMLAFVAAAALWHRQHEGGVARVDFSMIEAMLWTMAEPLIASQLGSPPKPMGNASARQVPHGVWRCEGDDDWISLVARSDAEWRALCDLVPRLSGMAALDLGQRREAEHAIDEALAIWAGGRSPSTAAEALLKAGIPAAALARHGDLVQSPHLAARGFWDRHDNGVLPGLPWHASFGRAIGPAPELGADADHVLATVLGLSPERIIELRKRGVLG